MISSQTLVFLETSLTQAEATEIYPDAVYRPSVKKGDVISAMKEGYSRIAIVDGNFGWTPSVWHKEILIALDYGLEVWGAASMGALRAAELDVYGMQGVGVVYDKYKTGVIDGDDEVAIAYFSHHHEQTVPLINLRLTLDELDLPLESKNTIFEQVKSIYYAQRTWKKIADSLPKTMYHLLYENYLDIKKQDALFLLNTLKVNAEVPNNLGPKSMDRAFTLFEKNLLESVFHSAIIEGALAEERRICGEVNNLASDVGQLLRAKNLIKLLSIPRSRKNLRYYHNIIYQIDQQKYTFSSSELMEQVSLFREENNLLTGRDFQLWLIKKYLFHGNLQVLFMDYIKLKKYFCISYNYNHFFIK